MLIQRPFGIYIHIPFCKRKCGYCDFYSVEGIKAAEEYTEALEKEITCTSAEFSYKIVDTLFIGGGTPSIFPLPCLSRIMDCVRKEFDLSGCSELTIECNPGTLTKEKAEAYRELGFNRVSIGAQSFNESELTFLNRIHGVEEILDSIRMIKDAGFENFNLDLIFGIPGQTNSDLVASLKTAIASGASHLSLYGLTIEEGTLFHDRLMNKEFTKINEEKYEAHYLTANAHLKGKGFNHYEVSNFSKPGKEALHNLNIWRGRDYLGFGASAHSRAGVKQWANSADLGFYIRNPVKKCHMDPLSDDQVRLERLMLGLRTFEGVPSGVCGSRKNIEYLKQRQLLIEKEGRVILTAEGMLLLDEVVLLLEGRRCLTLN